MRDGTCREHVEVSHSVTCCFKKRTNRCKAMPPEEIPLGAYTHINFAFALVNPKTFRIDAMDAETAKMYRRVTKLKERQPSLQVWIGQ